MSTVVQVSNLTKSYGNVTAVNAVSFSIDSNKTYGLLGRNGAGKTTIMRITTAQEFATSGDVQVFGEAPYDNSRVLSQICFVKDSQKYPKYLRVIDVLEVAPLFFPTWDRAYAFALIEAFRLPLNRRMSALSRDMLSTAGIFTAGKDVLNRQPLGGLVSATVMGTGANGNASDRRQAEALGLELAAEHRLERVGRHLRLARPADRRRVGLVAGAADCVLCPRVLCAAAQGNRLWHQQ